MIETLFQYRVFILFLLLISLFFIAKIINFAFFLILVRILSITKKDKEKNFFISLRITTFWLMFLIGVYYFREDILYFLNPITTQRILITLMVFFSAKIIINAINFTLKIAGEKWSKSTKFNLDEQILKLSYGAITAIMYSMFFLYALSVWGIELLPILGSLGVAGLAVALALQDPLQNLFGGVQILLDKNIKKGHIIQLSTGESGSIYDITLRSTKVKTWEGKLIIIPNKIMASTSITNISLPDTRRRVDISFGVEYGSDPDYVKEIILEEISKLDRIELQDPAPVVFFEDMGENALLFSARIWINQLGDFIYVKQKAITAIYDRLNYEGISIPFPQRTVWFQDKSKLKPKKYSKKKNNSTKKEDLK